jgi:hypothetical protein
VCLDLALDLLIPPLANVALNIVLLLVAGIAMSWLFDSRAWLWLGTGCAAGLCLHVLRGWQLSDTGRQGLTDLARTPLYMLWKILLMLRARTPTEWVRTRRELH